MWTPCGPWLRGAWQNGGILLLWQDAASYWGALAQTSLQCFRRASQGWVVYCLDQGNNSLETKNTPTGHTSFCRQPWWEIPRFIVWEAKSRQPTTLWRLVVVPTSFGSLCSHSNKKTTPNKTIQKRRMDKKLLILRCVHFQVAGTASK